jgi:hypothetical protein
MSKFLVASLRHIIAITFSVIYATAAFAAAKSPAADEQAKKEITQLLTTFLSPAENKTAAAHDRFWADDLVYTSSAGIVRSKAEILKLVGDAANVAPASAADPDETYTTEQILIRPYGNMAALNARLCLHGKDGTTSYYRVSGAFLKRHGKWQAVTWQATKETSAEK